MPAADHNAMILHHFDNSPFSEKVRLTFGLKGLSWRSVIIPSMLPKPDYLPLTGGYRRTPSLQIGADVYCDTQVILEEIEQRAPSPALLGPGLDWAVNLWADRLFFGATVPVIFGLIGDNVPEDFKKDRTEMSGRPFDGKAMAAAAPFLKQQWRAQAGWIEEALGKAQWLGGDRPTLSDIAAYMNVWFLGNATPRLVPEMTAGLPRLSAWAARMKAIGHGKPTDLSGEDALATAKAATPAAPPAHDPNDLLDAKPGDAVFVMADDYGKDQVSGTLVAATSTRIVIAREHDLTGKVHVHFPRAGYIAAKV
jgi:glutathione S-transferase